MPSCTGQELAEGPEGFATHLSGLPSFAESCKNWRYEGLSCPAEWISNGNSRKQEQRLKQLMGSCYSGSEGTSCGGHVCQHQHLQENCQKHRSGKAEKAGDGPKVPWPREGPWPPIRLHKCKDQISIANGGGNHRGTRHPRQTISGAHESISNDIDHHAHQGHYQRCGSIFGRKAKGSGNRSATFDWRANGTNLEINHGQRQHATSGTHEACEGSS